MTIARSRRLSLLLTFTLFALLAACSSPGPQKPETDATKPDTTEPTLLALLSEQTRTVTGDSILIIGSVSDDEGLKSFSYTLNGGKAKDVMDSLEDQAFSFTVTGLKQGENRIVITAADAAGNKVSAELKVSVVEPDPLPTFPAVEGTWVDAKVVKQVCGYDSVQTLTFMFDAPQESGALAGLWQVVDNDGGSQVAGSFAGTLGFDGAVTGTATLSVNTETSRFDLELTVAGGEVEGDLTGQTDVECNRDYDEESYSETLSYEVSLTPFVDDEFETNDSAAEATEIASDFSADLVLQGGDEDWFKFTLSEARLVTFDLNKTAGGYRSAYAHLLDAEAKHLKQLEFDVSDDYDHNTMGLEAGTYYLRVRSERLDHVRYTVSLSTAPLPDKAFEPNNTKAQATAVTSGFTGDFYLTLGDEDWFSFTLDKAQLVTLYLGDSSYELRYDFGDGEARYGYSSRPVIRAFEAGTHHVRVFVDNSRAYTQDGLTLAYPLSFTVTDLPDEALEPNDGFGSAKTVQLPFSADLFTGQGDEDWFAFELAEEQLVTFELENATRSVGAELYKSTGESLGSFSISNSERLRLLPAGSYRFKLSSDQGFTYTLSFSAETSNDSDFEDNDSREDAYPVTLDFEATNLLTGYDDEDWFTFELTEPARVRLALSPRNVYGYLYNEEESVAHIYGSEAVVLQAGSYYLYVDASSYLVKYDLSITAE